MDNPFAISTDILENVMTCNHPIHREYACAAVVNPRRLRSKAVRRGGGSKGNLLGLLTGTGERKAQMKLSIVLTAPPLFSSNTEARRWSASSGLGTSRRCAFTTGVLFGV